MLVIRTRSGAEIRVPLDDIESIAEIESASGLPRPIAAHPYLHREGVERCAACWKGRSDPTHSDTSIHG